MSGVKHRSNSCFVPGCKTGYKSDIKFRKERGEKSPSMFKTPNDPEIFEKWKRIIPRADKVLSENDCVCALHFPEEDISWFYETKLVDGSIERIKRGKPQLKANALPRIFPNLPSYLTDSRKHRKAPCERTDTPNIKRRKYFPLENNVASTSAGVQNPDQEVVVTPNDTPVEELINAEFGLFENLKESLTLLCMPYKQWSGTFIPGSNKVVFAEWDDCYITKKRIVIHQNMSFKVLFGAAEIKLDGAHKITGIDEIETILKSVDSMKICSGIKMISTSESCLGTVPLRKPGLFIVECSSCKRKLDRKNVITKSFIIKRHKKLKGVIKCVGRKNLRLKHKFFSERTAAAMEIYKDDPNLRDCHTSITLIKRLSTLIEIMNSRTPQSRTLKLGSNAEQYIKDFLKYLQEWKTLANDNNYLFLSENTYLGLIVTLSSTLEVMNFLCNNHGYNYLMTARLNQDALERFFLV